MKKIKSCLLAVILLVSTFLFSCSNPVDALNDYAKTKPLKVELIEYQLAEPVYIEFWKGYQVDLTYTLKNVSLTDCGWGDINFVFYDDNQERLGSMTAGFNDLKSGESATFTFTSTYYKKPPTSITYSLVYYVGERPPIELS